MRGNECSPLDTTRFKTRTQQNVDCAIDDDDAACPRLVSQPSSPERRILTSSSSLYSYPVLHLTTPTNDDKALANRAAQLELIQQLQDNLTWATGQGKGKYQAQHISRGMMLARDRLTMVLDEGSPWLEIGALSGFEWGDSTPSYVPFYRPRFQDVG